MKRLGLILLGTAAAACSAAPNLLPQNDLNRPMDVTFGCFGAYPTYPTDPHSGLTVSGRPMQACHPQDLYDPGPTTTSRTFAFMPESGSGGLTVVDADKWKLVDLDPFTAGYGQAPLGELPSQISASQDGCRLITANRGSCDLSLVDPSVLVAPTFYAQQSNQTVQPSPRTATMTIQPMKEDGTFLRSAPYEAVFLPQDTSSLLPYGDPQQVGPLCNPDGAMVDPIGWYPPQAKPAKPAPWYALVTYPSCDLIALVALPSGQIVSSAKVRATGDGKQRTVELVYAGKSPVCPVVDCSGQSVSPGVAGADASSPDAVSPPAATDGSADAGPTSQDAASDASLGGAPGDAAAPDAAGPGGASGASGMAGAAGTAGSGGAGGAAPSPGGAIPGNQYDNTPYVTDKGPIGPSGIAILPDGTRAYIALANASYVLSVGLTSSGLAVPANPILLNEGAMGSTRVRLNVDDYRQSAIGNGPMGRFVGAELAATGETDVELNHLGAIPDAERRRYLYAIARDGTVRVINVFVPGSPQYEHECETNLDPLHLPQDPLNPSVPVSATTACAPVDPKHRRPFSVGPGIHLPALPIDIAAADIRSEPAENQSEQSVEGAYAWIITDSGVVYLVNINPVLRKYTAAYASADPTQNFVARPVPEPEPFVNTLRDRNMITYSLTLDPSSGPPRVDVLPSPPAVGPYIEPFWTQGAELNATATSALFVETGVFFPQRPGIDNTQTTDNPQDPIDRRAITPQEWSVTWEGPLGGNRATGVVMGTQMSQGMFPAGLGTPMTVDSLIVDNGTNYCASGVLAGDLLTLTGCTQSSQCGLGEMCLLDTSVSSAGAGLPVNGLCVDSNLANQQAVACAPFLQSVRRYSIVAAYQNKVVVRPHLDELVRTPMTACDPAANLLDAATVASDPKFQTEYQPGSPLLARCPDPNDPTTTKFTCEADPEGGSRPRCLQKCDEMSACRAGRTCVQLQLTSDPSPQPCATSKNCFCADAPPLTNEAKAQCFDQLTSYQVGVGNGFLVSGSQSGVLVTAKVDPGDQQCAADPLADPRFTYRIPMNAPLCTNVDSTVISQIDGRSSPDLTGGSQSAAGMNARALSAVATTAPAPDPCLYWGGPVAGDPVMSTASHVRALFANSQVGFVLANLDRAPTGLFVTSFDVHGGFNPQVVQDPPTLEVSMPARIVFGPVDAVTQMSAFTATPSEQRYLFVVDQRRLGREQGGGPTRGQLLRIAPFGYTSTVGSATGYQPIFQDYSTSGGLFPIQ